MTAVTGAVTQIEGSLWQCINMSHSLLLLLSAGQSYGSTWLLHSCSGPLKGRSLLLFNTSRSCSEMCVSHGYGGCIVTVVGP